MKKYIYTLLAAGLIGFTSCDDKLELRPEDSVSSASILNSTDLIEGAVNGMYSKLQEGSVYGEPQVISELMSDNVNFVGSFPSLEDIRDFRTLANNASIDDIWIETFQVISAANLIINKFPGVDASLLSDADKNSYIGQAKFVRALMNLELVNQFAQPYQFSNGANLGIPLVLDFFDGDIAPFQKERSTLNEVHAQIEQDLLDAIAVLPVGDNQLASKGAAQALLARLKLYRGEWADAANLADEVIQSGAYTLATDYDFYNDKTTSSEHVFTVINNAADATVGTGFTNFYNAAPGGRGDAPTSADLFAAFDTTTDKRFTELFVAATDAGGNNTHFTTKFSDTVNGASLVPVIRITEMYLIRAEANLRNSSTVGDTPVNDINRLRTRAGLANLTTVNADQILEERRKELCFEGHRRMDLLRNDLNLRPGGGADSAPGADKVIYPIPTIEIQNNPNITQNPGAF